jgi:hypothetical protein
VQFQTKESAVSGQNKLVAELLRGLRHERDELRLQIHLGRKELQDELESLGDRIEALSERYKPVQKAVAQSTEDVWESMRLVGSEIREGFGRIRQSLGLTNDA